MIEILRFLHQEECDPCEVIPVYFDRISCQQSRMSHALNLYAIYTRNGTINILLPFTDLLRNTRPYVTRPASYSSHLLLRS